MLKSLAFSLFYPNPYHAWFTSFHTEKKFYFPPFVRSCGLADMGEVKVSVVRGATPPSQPSEMLKLQQMIFLQYIYLFHSFRECD